MELANSRWLYDIITSGRKMLLPRQLEPVSQYVAKHRFVSGEESIRAGLWDNTLTPFAVPVMDAFIDPEIERITMVGSSQVVKTEIIKNIIYYIVMNCPAPILIVYPTDSAARDFSIEKLEPMIAHNLELRERFSPSKSNSKDNKTLFKKFKGGFIAIVGGKVPQDLARRSIKYVIADDRDRITQAGMEGDSVALAWQRTESYTFLGRKLIEISSPTIDGLSPIMDSYNESDMGAWFVPCPHCNHYQVLNFDNLVWDKTETKDLFGNVEETIHHTETVKLKCINSNCGKLIDEDNKDWMVNNGKRICKHPERKNHFGFHIFRAYSLMSGWKNLVDFFLDSKEAPDKLMVFYNTALAKTWKLDPGETIDETGLYMRCEDYLTKKNPFIPKDVLYLTCAVDMQGDRLEPQVEGWGLGEENWVIHYEPIWGDPDMQDTWDRLDEFLEKTWVREDGVEMKLGGYVGSNRFYATVIDTGINSRSRVKAVYDYCLKRQHKGVMAIKGRPGTGLPPIVNRSRVGPYKQTYLYNLGVDTIKDVIWRRLKYCPVNEEGKFKGGPRTCHFTSEFCDFQYFKMLLSERPIPRYDRRNNQAIEWKKVAQGARNEPWDLKVYNYAAFLISHVNLEKLKASLLNKTDAPQIESKKSIEPSSKKVGRITMHRKSFVNSWRD